MKEFFKNDIKNIVLLAVFFIICLFGAYYVGTRILKNVQLETEINELEKLKLRLEIIKLKREKSRLEIDSSEKH